MATNAKTGGGCRISCIAVANDKSEFHLVPVVLIIDARKVSVVMAVRMAIDDDVFAFCQGWKLVI